MGGIFDDFEVVTPGQVGDADDIADLAAVMDWHDCGDGLSGGQGGLEFAFGVGDVQVEILQSAIDEDGTSAEVTDNLGRGGEGHGRNEDPLPCFEADGFEGEVESGGAGIDGDGVLLMDVAGKFGLELFGPWAGREPAAFEGGDDFVDFLRADAGFVEGNF